MDIQVNDVVQIVPKHEWGGCFLMVTKVKSWGIQGFVQVPVKGQAYIRLKHEDYVKIGRAEFVLQES